MSWLDEVTQVANSFRSSVLYDGFCLNLNECTEKDIMRSTAGVYYQWLHSQGETREGSLSERLEHCDLIYIPPLNYNDSKHSDLPSKEDGRGMGILFPTDSGDNIDEYLNWFRRDKCEHKMTVSCWAEDKNDSKLSTKLLARGFSCGFISNWLWLDMKNTLLDCSEYRILDGVSFRVVSSEENETMWKNCEEGHPCYKDEIWKTRQMHNAANLSGGKLVMFAAFIENVPIASATLYLGQGESAGVAGLYEVEVVRKYRGKGVGKAISYATCHYSKILGYRYVLGNSSDEGVPMYYKIGFKDFGRGRVYFLPQKLLEEPVNNEEIEFIEAIGEKDFTKLQSISKPFRNSKLSNGLTAIQLAIIIQRQEVALWLHEEQNFLLDIMSAHEMGWGEEISLLIQENRDLMNWRRGEHSLTPLHEASRDNKIELARVILKHKPDLSLVDETYGGTAQDWAQQCGSVNVLKAITKHLTPSDRKKKGKAKKKGKKKR